jgi:predicted transcriptional regulator
MSSDVLELLMRRSDLLQVIADEPRKKRDLVRDLDVSRSTIDRGVRELRNFDLVRYSDGYELTPTGRLAFDIYQWCLQRIQLLLEFEPLFRWFPGSAFAEPPEFDIGWLADADLATPDAGDPFTIVNRHVQTLSAAHRFDAMIPVTTRYSLEVGRERMVEHGAEMTLVVTPSVADTFEHSEDHAPLWADMVETGRVELYVYDGDLPYYVGVFDGKTVQVAVDDAGEPRALVEIPACPPAVEWAEATLGEYRAAAERRV